MAPRLLHHQLCEELSLALRDFPHRRLIEIRRLLHLAELLPVLLQFLHERRALLPLPLDDILDLCPLVIAQSELLCHADKPVLSFLLSLGTAAFFVPDRVAAPSPCAIDRRNHYRRQHESCHYLSFHVSSPFLFRLSCCYCPFFYSRLPAADCFASRNRERQTGIMNTGEM